MIFDSFVFVNTLLDGADGLVLAAETAIGQYPTQCVAMVSSMVDHFSEFHPVFNKRPAKPPGFTDKTEKVKI